MRIGIDETIFARFPGYRRVIVVGSGIDNRGHDPDLASRLRAAQEGLRAAIADGPDWRDLPRVKVWLETFRALGVGPGSRPPSVAALAKRVAKGSELPYISNLVALMNVVSLEHLVPCGGDDLLTVGDELLLRPATGDEIYAPLGAPDKTEHPDPGEIVYVDTATSTILCRCWCWRNSDVTKLTNDTTSVCLNLDLMSPVVDPVDDAGLAQNLADDLRRYCGGRVTWHLLTPTDPSAHFSF
jgi:DNA/RNA-binding domain of Phe-tRNA-synthetase-like protein